MKAQSVRILTLTRAHVAACAAIVAGSEPWKTLGEGLDFSPFLSRRGGAPAQARVAIEGTEVAGFILYSAGPVFARGAYIRALAVAPGRRSRGIGSLLLDFAEQSIAKHAANIFVCASSFNRRAQGFYRKAGYSRVGAIPGLIIPGASEYIFWKQLIPAIGKRGSGPSPRSRRPAS
ncbi:MAG: hypothetical protein A2X57_07865 [Nitrospirae bacterium GWD2_57_8]|nr:MAG: hypothetical protein A2X57_07865 [Nitrospirae bacterium GWD2_57_8]